MTTTNRARALAALAASVAVLATGCGGSGGGSGVSPQAVNPSQSAIAKAQKYSQCMRSHGVPDYPDPDPKTGRIQVKVTKGPDGKSGLDPSSAQFKTAEKACKSLQPPGLGSTNGTANPAMVKFAQCMRAHGVKNFPDPKGGKLVIGKGVDPNSPQFKAAQQVCRKYLSGGGIGS